MPYVALEPTVTNPKKSLLLMTVYHAPPDCGDCRKRYGFRSVVPATWNGKVIGAVELAADFGPFFLDYINQTFPGK